MAKSGMGEARLPAGPEFFGAPLEREALEFEGVTFRVFPLKANPHRLERFCEDYLNRELPEEIAHFRPAMPFVLLEIINYGRMSPRASNLGWLAQNEVVFAVPLEMYRKEKGRWVFVDWVTISPFIFVDDDLSTAEGREIYGWPKVLSSIGAEADPWMEDPRSRRRLLTLKTQMFSELFAGRKLEMSTLLQIEQRLPEAASQWTPDLSYIARPLLGPSGALMQGIGALADLSLTAVNRWREVGDPGFGMAREALRRGLRFGPQELYGNTINLKQFRGGEPRTVCYQALVNARFTFKKFHGGGPLGDIELMRGDTSGGFRIRIHRHPAYPIIESLGLEVFSEEHGRGRPISLLRPQFPCWFKADTRYEMGKRLAWRIESDEWLTTADNPDKPQRFSARRNLKISKPTPERVRKPPYNTSLGPVLAAVEEPFDFWDARVHAILLRAYTKGTEGKPGLEDFVKRRLAIPSEIGRVSLMKPTASEASHDPTMSWSGDDYGEFAPVMLQVTSYGAMSSAANDIGRWAEREVGFAVPIWLQLKGSRKALPMLFWAAVYSDSPIAVRTDREVTGFPAVQAQIRGGLDRWIDDSGADRNLLNVSVGAYPALHVGAQREQRLLLEIDSGSREGPGIAEAWETAPPPEADSPPEPDGTSFPDYSKPPAEPQTSQVSVVQPLQIPGLASLYDAAQGLELDHLAVKQFRDAERPSLACYQAVVAARTFIGRWHREGKPARVEADPTSYRVRLHKYESHPLVEDLGLCTTSPSLADDGSRVVELETYPLDTNKVHAFSMVVDLRHHLSHTLCWRGVGSPDWTIEPEGLEYARKRVDLHKAEIDSFDKFFEVLRQSVDGSFGLPGH